MNQGSDQQTNFEERLLAELRAVVAERRTLPATEAPATSGGGGIDVRRLAPRLALGGAGVAAVAAAVLAISSGTDDTSSAFAVEPQGEGNVRVEISSLEDAKGLEKALDDAGINSDVNYVEAGKTCREPRFEAAGGTPAKPVRMSLGIKQEPDGTVFTINRDAVEAGQTLVVTASPGPGGQPGAAVQVQVAEGAVGACVPVPAPSGGPTNAVPPTNGGSAAGTSKSGGAATAPKTEVHAGTGRAKGLSQSEG
ncbi:MAG: hypothetical protein QM729_20345 [Solirubrobacterales bacterium]